MNSRSPSGTPERREYFRISDRVHLRWRVVSDTECAEVAERVADAAGEEALGLQLQQLSSQAGTQLTAIRKRHPEIAHYLTLLDRKIELIARAVAGTLHKAEPNASVELGGGGIAFTHSEALAPETPIEVTLILFPGNIRISALGRVCHCRPATAGGAPPYRVGVVFERIDETAREVLVRHTLELQSTRLRKTRTGE